jgi:hypothetical protein
VAHLRRADPSILNLGYVGSGPVAFLRRIYEYLPEIKPKVLIFYYNEFMPYVLSKEEWAAYGFSRSLEPNRIGIAALQSEIDKAILDQVADAEQIERFRREPSGKLRFVLSKLAWRDILSFTAIRRSPLRANLASLAKRFARPVEPPAPSAEGTRAPAAGPASQQPTSSASTQPAPADAPRRTFGSPPIPPEDLAEVDFASPANLALLELVLQRARDFVAGWGGKVIFVYQPLYNVMEAPDMNVARGAALHDQVMAIASRVGYETIDLKDAVESAPDPFSFFPPGGGHYNAVGQRFIADHILAAMKAKNLWPESAEDESRGDRN